MSDYSNDTYPDPAASTLPALPFTFRRELTPALFRALQQQRSCAIMALRGVGLSNWLRFCAEPRIIASYLNPQIDNVLPVYVETGWLREPGELYREILRQMYHAAQLFQVTKADIAVLRYLDQQAGQSGAPDREELLSQALAQLCRAPQRRIILFLDEFDQPFVQFPLSALRRLRRWRDEHKTALCYVVGTQREMLRLLEQRADRADEALGKFTELFELQTYALRPYSPIDAKTMIARKLHGQPHHVLPDDEVRLYRLTGGHAKLLAQAVRVWEDRQHQSWPQIERVLVQDAALRERCADLWSDLEPYERAALMALIAEQRERKAEIPPQVLELLRLKGVLIGSPAGIFSIIFEAFVREQLVLPDGALFSDNLPAPLSRLRDPEPQYR